MAKIKSVRYGITDRGNFEGYLNNIMVAFWSKDQKGFRKYQAGAEEVLECVAELADIKVKGLSKTQRRN